MINREGIYIFGGTFDPIHEGHLGVVREVIGSCGMLVIAPTDQNPYKSRQPTPLDCRLEMIELVLKAEGIAFVTEPGSAKVVISQFGYQFACDFVRHLRDLYRGDIYWIVGPDIVEEVPGWRDWPKLGVSLYVSNIYADNLHSQSIRRGIAKPHPALKEFIRERGIYKNAAT